MEEVYIKRAIEISKLSGNDVPVGAIIVKDGKIIAEACNTKEVDNDVTSHAEITAIRKAEKALNNWRLKDCEIYITLEPCPMCAAAILQSGIKKICFGTYDTVLGAIESKINLPKIYNSKAEIIGGIMENECNAILKEYFKKIRQ